MRTMQWIQRVIIITLFTLLAGCATTTHYSTPPDSIKATCPLCKKHADNYNQKVKNINGNLSKISKTKALKKQYYDIADDLRAKIQQVNANPNLTDAQKTAINRPTRDLINKHEQSARDANADMVKLINHVKDQRKQLIVLKQLFDTCEKEVCKAAETGGDTTLGLFDTSCADCKPLLKQMNTLIKKRSTLRHQIHGKMREANRLRAKMTRIGNRIRVEKHRTTPNTAILAALKRQLNDTQRQLAAISREQASLVNQIRAEGAKLADVVEKWRICERDNCQGRH